MSKIKKIFICIAIIVLTCAVSSSLTFWICETLSESPEEKVMISLVGENKAAELEKIKYSFSRSYILKDGTIIEANGGSGVQEF